MSRLDTDAILPIQDPYMEQIIDGRKNYEFRKYCLKPSVQRIWFYRTAPHSSITHVCEILPARTATQVIRPWRRRVLGTPISTAGIKIEGYDFAYKITSVYELRRPVLSPN